MNILELRAQARIKLLEIVRGYIETGSSGYICPALTNAAHEMCLRQDENPYGYEAADELKDLVGQGIRPFSTLEGWTMHELRCEGYIELPVRIMDEVNLPYADRHLSKSMRLAWIDRLLKFELDGQRTCKGIEETGDWLHGLIDI